MKNRDIIIAIVFISILFAAMPGSPKVFLIGDSTMAPKKEVKRPETGWGEILPKFFTADVVFINKARNGRSTRTFIEEERWDTVYNSLSNGDYVFIQFGHNDQSKEKVDRYTSPEDFENNLIKFINDVRSKNAIPILLTPIVRRRFDETEKFYDVHGIYPEITRKVAEEYKVFLIDHHKLSKEVVSNFGEEESKNLFLHLLPDENENYPNGIIDDTHLSPKGALIIAELVKKSLLNSNLKLKEYIK